jgi:hypothetical protein
VKTLRTNAIGFTVGTRTLELICTSDASFHGVQDHPAAAYWDDRHALRIGFHSVGPDDGGQKRAQKQSEDNERKNIVAKRFSHYLNANTFFTRPVEV